MRGGRSKSGRCDSRKGNHMQCWPSDKWVKKSLLNHCKISNDWWRRRQSHCLINQWLKMRNADYAPTNTPKSIRLINCLKSNRFYRSSGADHASNRSSASVLPIRACARRSRSIVRSRCSSGKSQARRVTSCVEMVVCRDRAVGFHRGRSSHSIP